MRIALPACLTLDTRPEKNTDRLAAHLDREMQAITGKSRKVKGKSDHKLDDCRPTG
jgi:hypothetical protein